MKKIYLMKKIQIKCHNFFINKVLNFENNGNENVVEKKSENKSDGELKEENEEQGELKIL